MSHLEKIQITGIRSFSPSHDHMQTIEFHHPLTVILGRNGAGKTTVIEACLNACTGQLPFSGAEKGSFVHDPRVAGEADVRAQIRLTFVAKDGRRMQCTRTYQSTSAGRGTAAKFQTLDASLAYYDENRKVKSSTYRVADMDKMLPELLGVSSAVLQHVVFCHQEEGNWPLDKSSEIKQRFDDIFASTKYVEALEKFREAQKSYRVQAKNFETQLLVHREYQDGAQQLRKELDDKEKEVSLIIHRSGDIDLRCTKLSRVISTLDAVSTKAEGLQQQRDRLRGILEEKTKTAKDMRSRRKGTEPLKPMQEVQMLLQSHEDLVKKAVKEKKEKESAISRLEADRSEIGIELNAKESALAALRDKEATQQRRVSELQSLIAKTAKKLEMELPAIGQKTVDEQGLLRFLEAFESKTQELKQYRDAMRNNNENETKSADKVREAAATRLSALMREKQQKQTRRDEGRAEMQKIEVEYKAEPTFARCTEAAVEAFTKELEALQQNVRQRKAKVEKSNLRNEHSSTLAQIEEANKKSKALRAELDERIGERDIAARLGLLRTSLKDKEGALDAALKNKVWPQMKQLVGRTPEISKLQKEVDTTRLAKDGARRNAEKAALEMEKQLARQTHSVEEMTRQVQDKEKFVEERTKALAETLGGDSQKIIHFDKVREEAETASTDAIKQITFYETQLRVVDEAIETSKKDSMCETCKRPLSKSEKQDFLETQTKIQKAARANIEKAQKVHQEKQVQLATMRKVQADVQDLNRVRDIELPPLRTRLMEAERQRASSAAALKDLKSAEEVAKQDVSQVAEVSAEVTRVLALHAEIQTLTQAVTKLEKEAGVSTTKCSLDLVATDYDKTQRRLQDLNQALVKLQTDVDAESKDLQGLESALHAKELEVERQNANRIRANALMSRHEALKSETAACEGEIAELSLQIKRTEQEVNEATLNVETKRTQHRRAEAQAQETLDNYTREGEVLRATATGVKEHIAQKVEERIATLTGTITDLKSRQKKISESLTGARDEFHRASRFVDEQQTIRHDLEDSAAIHSADEDVGKCTRNVKALEDELKSMQQQHLEGMLEGTHRCGPEDTLWTVREKVKAQMHELQQQAAHQKGTVDHLQREIISLKDKLTQAKYVDIEKRVTSMQIKLRTAELAITDIEKYHKALDKAVTQYHSDKMKELNGIINNLWRTTYAGSDIDTIEIKFDEDLTGTTAPMRSNRSFKYRVVMRKGDAEIDMRGRCSAGQKVLASVVIRLALSEAFCCECGVLVLDEPTTNLDEDNVMSLARALRAIIDTRRLLRHFQLVVITHDEMFVRELGQSHAIESYYYVHKTMDGRYSVIDKMPIDKLFS